MKFLAWLLRLFGFVKLAAALEGAKQGLEAQQVQEQQAAIQQQQQIVQEAQDGIALVENKTDDELASDAVALGILRRDGDAPDGSPPG